MCPHIRDPSVPFQFHPFLSTSCCSCFSQRGVLCVSYDVVQRGTPQCLNLSPSSSFFPLRAGKEKFVKREFMRSQKYQYIAAGEKKKKLILIFQGEKEDILYPRMGLTQKERKGWRKLGLAYPCLVPTLTRFRYQTPCPLFPLKQDFSTFTLTSSPYDSPEENSSRRLFR